MSENQTKSSVILLVAVWLIVGIPAAWGVGQTINKSLDLFRASHSAGSSPATRAAPRV